MTTAARTPLSRARRGAAWAAIAVVLLTAAKSGVGRGNASTPDYDNPRFCSTSLADGGPTLTPEEHHRCVLAVASTWIDGEQHSIAPSQVLLDPEVSRYQHGSQPDHRPGNAAALRSELDQVPLASVHRIVGREWTVDGNDAFVAYTAYTGSSATIPDYWEAERMTIRRGLIWEIMTTPAQQGQPGSTPSPPVGSNVVPVTSTPPPTTPNYDDATFCTTWIGEHGDASLTADQHRRCMIAIATSYIDAEENSAPAYQILFDPRVSRYSEGASPIHRLGNDDAIRIQEGTETRVIAKITNRRWTVDGDVAWIAYDGYLVSSLTHPGFWVAERITIHNGLVWEIMITPVRAASVPAG